MTGLTLSSPVGGDLLDTRVVVDCYLGDEQSGLADDVLDGLTRPFKELPSKYLYDAAGAELFDRICTLPEYYPTSTERAILGDRSGAIADRTGAVEVVELGSGTAEKSRLLLDALSEAGTLRRYVPIDVTEGMVREVAHALVGEYDGLEVHGIVGDFERHLDRLPPACGPRLVVCLGGTVGNLLPGSRRRFLRSLTALLGPEDHLLIGTDVIKDRTVIEAAYDDRAGVTAEFNRNMLRVLNSALGADFEPEAFDHVAFFDDERNWVEMRLRAQKRMTVQVRKLNLTVEFAPREELRTEISAKFTREELDADLADGGLVAVDHHRDADDLFELTLARRVAPAAGSVHTLELNGSV